MIELIPRVDEFIILAIDPGTNSCGFSILSLNLSTGNIDVVRSFTKKAADYLRGNKELVEMHGEKDIRNHGYVNTFLDLLSAWRPEIVVIEDAFMSRFPAAFAALREQTQLFRIACYQKDPHQCVMMVEPSRIKKHMKVKGGDKDLMTEALRKRKDVSYSDDVVIDELDEHSIDSVCIGLFSADRVKRVIDYAIV